MRVWSPQSYLLFAAALAAPIAIRAQGSQAGSVAASVSPSIAIGKKVFDPQGGDVGTIEALVDGNAVVSTGTRKVTLPSSAFGTSSNGLIIAMTREQLHAAAEKSEREAAAALAAAIKPGAEVRSIGGNAILGTVKSIGADALTLTTPGGDVLLPRSAFVMNASGLAVSLSAQQFEDAVKAAKAPK